MHTAQRSGDGLHRSGNSLQLSRLRLKLREGTLQACQRALRIWGEERATGALDLVQRPHRVRDRGCQLE
jgi:hypothetical protein